MINDKTTDELKDIVKEKYATIADQDREQNKTSCCGASCCTADDTLMAEDYSELKGYVEDADLGLGCGLPTKFALINAGNTVVDLGSGAGNDAFIARAEVGDSGKVIGIDMTGKMIEKARRNAEKLGFNNVEFRLGDIEDLPLSPSVADVIVSNCVLNLVPNKAKAFNEAYRVLKPGGHFSVSDIVLQGELPDEFRHQAELYAGCISGAIQKGEYLQIIRDAGFINIKIQKEKPIVIPEEILSSYLDESVLQNYRLAKTGITSVTVYAEKPMEEIPKKKDACCAPGCCDS
jgi:ubiquinone/menaquinone biosynthesis C-methylase UbiE